MFNRCREMLISINLEKCIFCVPHGNVLGHIICREGFLVDPTKIAFILNIPPPTSANFCAPDQNIQDITAGSLEDMHLLQHPLRNC